MLSQFLAGIILYAIQLLSKVLTNGFRESKGITISQLDNVFDKSEVNIVDGLSSLNKIFKLWILNDLHFSFPNFRSWLQMAHPLYLGLFRQFIKTELELYGAWWA